MAAPCCATTLTGFCLQDGTPVGIVVLNGTQTGWIDFTTGITTPGPPPAGTELCAGGGGNLDCLTDSVEVCQGTVPWGVDVANASVASAPVQTVTGAAAVLFSANPLRRSFTIQNTGTEPIKVTFGAVNPTSTDYHFALAPGAAADDGKGSFYTDDQWSGEVRVFSDNPGSLVAMEIT